MDFPRAAIEACLDRIGASEPFSHSPKLRRFLRLTVEAALEGRANALKERTIGVEVYERPAAYDPRADPIVRTEAHRLRKRLAAYYAREGSTDPIIVAYPKGTYVPELRPNKAGAAQSAGGCRLLVGGLEDRSPSGRHAAFTNAIGETLRARLASWPGIQVVDAPETPGPLPADAHLEADYRVEGTVECSGGHGVLMLRLVRLADGKQIWSEAEALALERAGETKRALAEHLATSIGAALSRTARFHRPTAARAYDLYVKARHSVIRYGNVLDARELERARSRLRAALEQKPEYVDALAELAQLELMHLYPPRGDVAQIVASARSLLERALVLEPRHARSLYLLGHVEGSAQRTREALRLTESAVAIDPEDAEGRTMLAARYASMGFWESSVAACDWAIALDAVWDAPYRIKTYLLTRMGRLDATRAAIDELARRGTSPTEVAMARFDLRIAERDYAGARAALASLESTFPLRPDLEDRRVIAHALAEALEGRRREARATLAAHGRDGPRFWDHTIRLALALGEDALAHEIFVGNPINRSYRWLATEDLVRPYLQRPRWRELADELQRSWLRDLEEVGPRLPVPPAALLEPAALASPVGGCPPDAPEAMSDRRAAARAKELARRAV